MTAAPTGANDLPTVPVIPSSGSALRTLNPSFSEQDHGFYRDRLAAALADRSPAAATNIALSGPYGSGKSSVLESIVRQRRLKVVRISLSTVNSKADLDNDAISGQIQKEIVKQILYRETPWKMAGSRYRRVRRFGWLSAAMLSSTVAILSTAVFFLSGASVRLDELARRASLDWWLPPVVSLLVFSCVSLLSLRLAHGRLRITRVSAGSTSVEVSASEDAFDRYLDEIVHFFSASKCSVVVFEDLDRFEQIEIFEELRALNVLLNNSRQIRRPVRFIYAIRDSLFDTLSEPDTEAPRTGEASDNAEVDYLGIERAAKRSKFFDLVIPMVPFATQRTSIDLWRTEFPESTSISVDALRVISRYIRDMRLIKTIRNEYSVFTEELTKNQLSGLSADKRLAVVVYKNIHVEDFELIQAGQSKLDAVEDLRQRTVTAVMAGWDQEVSRNARHTSERLANQARDLGSRLFGEIGLIYRKFDRSGGMPSFTVGDSNFEEDQLGQVGFWLTLRDNSWTLLTSPANNPSKLVELELADLIVLLGLDPSELQWEQELRGHRTRMTREQRDRLVGSDMSRLMNDDDFLSADERVELRESVGRVIVSPLGLDLISTGLIDKNFSLYATRFYGRVVSATAMNFVLHIARPRRYAPFANLSSREEIEAVAWTVGPEFFSSPSALNVSIFDVLFHDERIVSALDNIEADGILRDFFATYAREGRYAAELTTRLASRSSFVFKLLFEPDLDLDTNSFISAALLGISQEISYAVPENFATQVDESLASIGALVDTATQIPDQAALKRLLTNSTMRFSNLAMLSSVAQESAILVGAFALTEENLGVALGEPSNWSLDKGVIHSPAILGLVLEDMGAYLHVLPLSVATISADPDVASWLLRISDLSASEIQAVVTRAHTDFVVSDLAEIPPATWQPLARARRLRPNARNLLIYARRFGLDRSLAGLLRTGPLIDNPLGLANEERSELAGEIAKARWLSATRRKNLIRGLRLETTLELEAADKFDADMISMLVAIRTIPDNEATFEWASAKGWEFCRALMLRSKRFEAYVGNTIVSDDVLLRILEDPVIAQDRKVALVRSFASYPERLSRSSADGTIRFLEDYKGTLNLEVFRRLAKTCALRQELLVVLMRYNFTPSQLVEVLNIFGGKWAHLSGAKRRRPLLPPWPVVEAVLKKVQPLGAVMSWATVNGQVKVEVRPIRR